MFERNKVDSGLQQQQQQTAVAVELTFDDGRLEKGRIIFAVSRSISDVLNGPVSFLEFEPWNGERTFVAKSSITALKLTDTPPANQLGGRMRELDTFDPRSVLGVSVGATADEIRSTYVQLAKAYHPDRYATAELPQEVREYLSTMARRVTSAYQALQQPVQIAKKVEAERAAAVYTSRPRA